MNGKAHGDIPADDGTMESHLARNRWLDEQDPYIDHPINFPDLPEAAQRDGESWPKAVRWRKVDALAWVARREPELMKLIRAYGAYMRAWSSAPDEATIERACRLVLISHIGEDWREFERLLLAAERDGILCPNDNERMPFKAAAVRAVFPASTPALAADSVAAPQSTNVTTPMATSQPKIRRGTKSGPKSKYASNLQAVFQRLHDHLVEMSEKERHKLVVLNIKEGDKKPKSPRTTALHWDRYLERRAQEAR